MPRIALVAPDLSVSGGVGTVVQFLHDVIERSSRFEADVFSVSLSSSDRCSVQLRTPSTWLRGVQVASESSRGLSYRHVGACATEIEYFRYQPRSVLTDQLSDYDLIQVVAGTPAWAHLCRDVSRPVALQVATLARVERATALEASLGVTGLWRRWMTRMTDRLDRQALQHADVVFVENQWMHEWLQETAHDATVLFAPPGVDAETFTPGPPPSEGTYILAVGRLADTRKNVKLLFEAYARLRQIRADVPPLVLAGRTGPSSSAWEHADALGIRSDVEFKEDVSADALTNLYQNAAVYALSSDEEGLGLTILEAMACGRPVVSTDCGGPSTTVVDGETGYLTPVGDADALANALRRVLSTPQRADAMGRAGRLRVEKHFSTDASGRRFLDAYDQLLPA